MTTTTAQAHIAKCYCLLSIIWQRHQTRSDGRGDPIHPLGRQLGDGVLAWSHKDLYGSEAGNIHGALRPDLPPSQEFGSTVVDTIRIGIIEGGHVQDTRSCTSLDGNIDGIKAGGQAI